MSVNIIKDHQPSKQTLQKNSPNTKMIYRHTLDTHRQRTSFRASFKSSSIICSCQACLPPCWVLEADMPSVAQEVGIPSAVPLPPSSRHRLKERFQLPTSHLLTVTTVAAAAVNLPFCTLKIKHTQSFWMVTVGDSKECPVSTGRPACLADDCCWRVSKTSYQRVTAPVRVPPVRCVTTQKRLKARAHLKVCY